MYIYTYIHIHTHTVRMSQLRFELPEPRARFEHSGPRPKLPKIQMPFSKINDTLRELTTASNTTKTTVEINKSDISRNATNVQENSKAISKNAKAIDDNKASADEAIVTTTLHVSALDKKIGETKADVAANKKHQQQKNKTIGKLINDLIEEDKDLEKKVEEDEKTINATTRSVEANKRNIKNDQQLIKTQEERITQLSHSVETINSHADASSQLRVQITDRQDARIQALEGKLDRTMGYIKALQADH